MLKRSFSFIICCLFAVFPILTVNASTTFAPTISITSRSAYFVNLDTNTVVYEKEATAKMQPAALTKIMTCLLVFENVKDINESFTSNYDDYPSEIQGTSTADIRPGETLTIDQLLGCVIVQSANEACTILARRVSGSIPKFVALMNKRAKELGCKSTNFANPTGLKADDNYTTASDMYLITKAAIKFPRFLEISALARFTIPPTNKNTQRVLVTTNSMIDAVNGGDLYYKYATGIKAGRTDNSNRSVVESATKSGFTYLSIMMGGGASATGVDLPMYESKKMFEWAFSSISYRQIASASDQVAEMPVTLAWDANHVLLTPKADLYALLPKDVDLKSIKPVIRMNKSTQAPIKKGQTLGEITYLYNGNELGKTSLVASQAIARSTPLYYAFVLKNFVGSIWFKITVGLIVALVIAYFVLTLLKNKNRNKSRKVKKVKYKKKMR